MTKQIIANDNPESFLEQLTARGLVQDQTPKLKDYLSQCAKSGEIPRVYAGFDPSAPSLQAGNLLPALMLRRAQLSGVQPIILVGGATGLIGDPSGKKEERTLQDEGVARANLEKQKAQLEALIDTSPGKYQALVRNNFDWFKDFRFLDFLREVGKHVSVNYMTAKDSVKIRMETGISYAEFGYMLVQGYDFMHLYEKDGCRIQIGGSDQWGNMTTGLELIRRKHQAECHALSAPLLTDAAGNKLGKSEKGALYLDAKMTSPFQFYQYWLGQADADVPKLLKAMTLLAMEEVQAAEEQIRAQPEQRAAQKLLAQEITRIVHGNDATAAVENASRVLFSKDPAALASLGAKGLEILAGEVPSTRLAFEQSIDLIDLLAQTGLCASKGEARRHLKGGAVTVNRVKISDEQTKISGDNFTEQPFLLLGIGKSNLHLVLKA